jgi:hypothetical protein
MDFRKYAKKLMSFKSRMANQANARLVVGGLPNFFRKLLWLIQELLMWTRYGIR